MEKAGGGKEMNTRLIAGGIWVFMCGVWLGKVCAGHFQLRARKWNLSLEIGDSLGIEGGWYRGNYPALLSIKFLESADRFFTVFSVDIAKAGFSIYYEG
jgi:hypothetical protein